MEDDSTSPLADLTGWDPMQGPPEQRPHFFTMDGVDYVSVNGTTATRDAVVGVALVGLGLIVLVLAAVSRR